MEKESSERRRRNVGRRKTPLSYQLHHLKNRVLTALPSPHNSHPVLILLFLPIQFRNLFIRYVLYNQKFRQFNATIQTSWTPTKHTIQCYRLARMSRGSRPVPILLLLPFHFIRYMLDKQKFRQFIATTHDFLDQTSFRKFPSCAYESGNLTNCSTFQFPLSDYAQCPLVISNSTAFNTFHLTQTFSNSNGSTCATLSQENSYAVEGAYFPSCQYQRRPESNFELSGSFDSAQYSGPAQQSPETHPQYTNQAYAHDVIPAAYYPCLPVVSTNTRFPSYR